MTNDKKKFTPGPWRVVRGDSGKANGWNIESVDDVIADCSEYPYYAIAQEADAHLIAASPLMYEALKAVQNDMKQIGTLHPDTDYLVTKALSAVEGKK